MKSDSQIFISFKTSERETASMLKDALIKSDYKVWWQEEIQCGQEWHGEIDKALLQAGAIVVLWSEAALSSEWVKHEASQAIARGIYAPVRIEVVGIESPFNRIQATDLYHWNGELNAPGFQNLLLRLSQLMPPPVPNHKRIVKFIRTQILAIVLFVITAGALYLLITQSSLLNNQAKAQKELEELLQKTSNNVDASTENTDRLFQETRDSINTQFRKSNLSQMRQEELTDKINNSSSQTVENLDRAINSLTRLGNSQKQVLENFKEFETKISNEVFEVWVKINGTVNFSTENISFSFSNQFLNSIQDSTYYESFTRNPYQYKLESDSKILTYIRNYDFREINWLYKPGYSQGILNHKDFDKASIKYQNKRYKKTGALEFISVTLIKSFPIEHFISNLEKNYLTFENFANTSIILIPEKGEYFSSIYSISLYLIGKDKMKVFEFRKDYSDGYIENIQVLNGWREPNVLKMNVPEEFYSRIQFTRKANILSLIE
ncbi:MAG: toll/interleukin-1 receptor domain-containing protein [Flavobacteriales bacterium]|nr:toll/interleukin-1 receptor domain-containing protein [Flavobacteriales bacterium]